MKPAKSLAGAGAETWPSNIGDETIFHGAPGRALLLTSPVAALPGNAYTFTLLDPGNLISASIEAQIGVDAQYVIGLISRYLNWQGTMDFAIEIRPDSQSPFSADGLLPSVVQLSWNGTGWVNDTLVECMTGIDNQPGNPDAGCIIYLAEDGTIRNYGSPVWFDPDPRLDTPAGVPAGTHDFVGILTHEIFHGFGFNVATQAWLDKLTTSNGLSWFNGPGTAALYGGPVPFIQGSDHYGKAEDPSIPISRGLMFQYGNYEGNRLDIGLIDLAILGDLGHTLKTTAGLPLFELIDNALNLTGSAGGDALYGDYHNNILTGQSGADALLGGAGNDRLEGGLDTDRLAGGTGADIFVFASLNDSRLGALRSDGAKFLPDIIADFASGTDKIDLSALDAVSGVAGNQAFSFIGASAFSGQAGQLRFDIHGGRAFIYADVDGNGHADLQIIAVTPLLQASDFIL